MPTKVKLIDFNSEGFSIVFWVSPRWNVAAAIVDYDIIPYLPVAVHNPNDQVSVIIAHIPGTIRF